MLIIGAKGFAKEVLEIFSQQKQTENIAFYDDVNTDIGDLMYQRYPIIKNENEAIKYFKATDNKFTIGIGSPKLRNKLFIKFTGLGGEFTSSISPLARIGSFGNEIGEGSNIMTGTIITNDIKLGKGVLINLSCTIGHDTIIGEFAELCPDVNVSGNCYIGDFSFIGTNATILPNIKIGKNVIVGAGSVVTKDIPDNCLAIGTPAKIIKELEPLDF
jgi:sugar O-acyltransferase (sialic acid O-acetyltransferase NeuD family)